MFDFLENLLVESRKDIEKKAIEVDDGIIFPNGRKSHDALYDCYKELKILNGALDMVRDKITVQ